MSSALSTCKIPSNRKGFKIKATKQAPSDYVSILPPRLEPVVYWNSKLTHTGITGYKVFENVNRHVRNTSLKNLLHQVTKFSDELNYFIAEFQQASSDDAKCKINDLAVDNLSNDDYTAFIRHTFQARKLNPTQSRKIKNLCTKLAFYSAKREFMSKKSGKYSFKVAFLTLTAPEIATIAQILAAFDAFLDYLRRTANCVYVYKKELGEKNGHLHFHILINNFIPYYIVEWKWRRLLIGQGVEWPKNDKGMPTMSHYRIEVPKSKKQIAYYLAKYMSKAYDLPRSAGYIAGHSKILDELKEMVFIEGELPENELKKIMSSTKVIKGEFVTHVCCNLLNVKKIAPEIGAYFEAQYIDFYEKITLPQKFFEC